MRKLSFLVMLCMVGFLNAQNYDPNFLDGTVMFELNIDPVDHGTPYQRDKNEYGLDVYIGDYPEIAAALRDINVAQLEIASYFTGKESLQKIFRLKFADFDKIDDVVARLSDLPNVKYAEKEPVYFIDFVPNDTYHTGTNKWYHTLVGSENAWNISVGSSSIKVAIVDNAVFCGHADLTTYLQRDVADSDNNATPPSVATVDFGWSHGTHCAGLATADMNNNNGIASLGAAVELIGVKTTPNSASSSSSIWYGYNGVQWACQNGAHVVSMSYGSSSYSASMQTLINAYSGIVFIAAAGNDGNTTPKYPGAYNNVICVGSVNANDIRSSFSNYNGATPFVDIASPGGYSYGGLISTVYTSGGNGYDQMGGTSMATPFAAGLVGLMLSVNPTMTPSAVESCLLSSGVNISQNIGPRIDAYAALQCVQATLTGDPIPYFTGTPTSVTEGDYVTFTDLSADGGFPITNWTWTFPGGTPSSYIGQTPPAIQYNTAGLYDVTLSVTNSTSTQVYTASNYINVTPPPYGEWLEQASAFTTASVGINYISIVDQNIVWATGYDGSGGGGNLQKFTKTTNGGTTWTPGNINLMNSNLGVSMIHAINATTAWCAAYPTGAGQTGGIWKTSNGGTTWSRQNTALFNNSASFTNVVYFWDANNGFCQGDPIGGEFELYTTTNGGTTWVPVPGASIPNPSSGSEFGYTRQIEVVGNNVWFTTSLGRIYHSTDKGYTWTVYNSPVADFGGAVTSGMSANLSFSSATTGLIVDINGNVYKTTNSGATWTPVTTAGTVFTNSLCYIEGTNTVFTTGAGTGTSGSSYSDDGGTTWNTIDTEQHLYVDFINPSVGWSGWFNASSSSQGMWKWNNLSSAMTPAFTSDATNTCTATTVTYTDLTTGSTPIAWNWTFEGGTPATSTAASPTVTYAASGTFDVTLTVDDGTSITTIIDSNYINVVDPAAVPGAISGSNTLCENDTETYSVTNDPSVVYNWTIPAGWTGSSTTNSITVTANTTPGTISVTAENICGNSAPSSLPITLLAGPPTAGFSSSNVANDYSFTSTSTNATSWSWDFGDSGTSTLENPTHLYTSNGTFTVTLIASNSCGSDTTTIDVTITVVGLDELNANYMRIFPNPTNDWLTFEVDAALLDATFEIVDVVGHQLMSGVFNELSTNVNVEAFSSGVYFVRITNRERSFRFVKK